MIITDVRRCFIINKNVFEILMGIETHLYIFSNYKLFSGLIKSVHQLDEGLPGSLPIINTKNLKHLTSLIKLLNVNHNPWISFTRKNYFYSDLPLGYQITQHFYPLMFNGLVSIFLLKINKKYKKYDIFLQKICLEHDAAKITRNKKYINYLRAGTSLIEIVTEPCFNSILNIKSFFYRIILIFVITGISSCIMADANIRYDFNISFTRPFHFSKGKSEIKNLNCLSIIDKVIINESNVVSTYNENLNVTKSVNQKSDVLFTRAKKSEINYKQNIETDLLPIKLWIPCFNIKFYKNNLI